MSHFPPVQLRRGDFLRKKATNALTLWYNILWTHHKERRTLHAPV